MVVKAKTKKQDGTNGRVLSGYTVHMYSEGLDRHVLTVQVSTIDLEPTISTISHHEFTWSAKSTLEKQTS